MHRLYIWDWFGTGFRAWLLGGLLVCLLGVEVRADQPPAVATIAGEPLLESTFRARYVDYLLQTGQHDAPAQRHAFLNTLVAGRLLVREAQDAGITAEPGYAFQSERLRRKLLIEAYLHRMVYDTLQVTEAELQAMFIRANTTLTARHLYARTRAQADALYARLQNGEPFEALAYEVFADTALANNGGSLGTFSFDEMDPSFEDAAYALKIGEVSEPVRTAQGYSIIRLDDRFTPPLLTEQAFAEKREQMHQYVTHRKQTAAQQHLFRAQAETLAPHFNAATFEALLAQLTGQGVLPSEQADAPLVTFGPLTARQTWMLSDFQVQAQYAAAEQRANLRTRKDLEGFIQGLLIRERFVEAARGLEALPEFEMAHRDALNDWVQDQALQRLMAQMEIPADTIRAYYDRFADEFVQAPQVRLREIMVDTRVEAQRLYDLLDEVSFETLALQHSVRPDTEGGDLGWIEQDDLGSLMEPVQAAAVGEVIGPLEVAGRYVVLRIEGRRAGQPMTFADAQPDIQQRLRPYYARQFLRAHVAHLQTQYPVTIDTERVNAMSLRGL